VPSTKIVVKRNLKPIQEKIRVVAANEIGLSVATTSNRVGRRRVRVESHLPVSRRNGVKLSHRSQVKKQRTTARTFSCYSRSKLHWGSLFQWRKLIIQWILLWFNVSFPLSSPSFQINQKFRMKFIYCIIVIWFRWIIVSLLWGCFFSYCIYCSWLHWVDSSKSCGHRYTDPILISVIPLDRFVYNLCY